jgi:hypothetical protein
MKLSVSEYLLNKIDLTIDELKTIPSLIKAGDISGAESCFAGYVRSVLRPEKYFRLPYYAMGGTWKSENETEEDIYKRLLHNEVMSCSYRHDFGEAGIRWEDNPTPNHYYEWTWQLNRHHEFRMLGHLYRETGNEEIARLFVRMFTSWRESTVCPDDAPGYDTLAWRTIEIGIRETKNWNYAIHAFLMSPELSDHFICEFFASMWENGWRLRCHPTSNNWLIMEMTGLFHIGLLYPWVKDAEEWKNFAISTLVSEMDRQIYPDCFQIELSTGYHMIVSENCQTITEICHVMDEPVPEPILRGIARIYDLCLKLADPSMHTPSLNDGGRVDVSAACKKALKLFPERQDYLYFASLRKEGTPPEFTDIVLPYSGMVVFRDSWEEDSQWAFFESAPFGAGHQHEDKLNFLLYAYGRDMLKDTGNFAYDSSKMRQYVLSSESHNTVLVDGMAQNRRKKYKWNDGDINKLSDLRVKTGKEIDCAVGIYNEGYGPDLLDVVHKRSVYKSKSHPLGLGIFYILIDSLTSPDGQDHRYDAHWQLEAVPYSASPARGSDITGADYLAKPVSGSKIIADYGDGVTLTLLSGANYTVRCGSFDPFVGWRTPNIPAPAIDFTIFGSSGRIVTLFYPSDSGRPIESIEYDSSAKEKDIKIITKNGVIFFDGEKITI